MGHYAIDFDVLSVAIGHYDDAGASCWREDHHRPEARIVATVAMDDDAVENECGPTKMLNRLKG